MARTLGELGRHEDAIAAANEATALVHGRAAADQAAETARRTFEEGSLAEHLHMHVVPLWSGDANFITIVGGSKVIPQLLRETRELLATEWANQP